MQYTLLGSRTSSVNDPPGLTGKPSAMVTPSAPMNTSRVFVVGALMMMPVAIILSPAATASAVVDGTVFAG